MTEPNVILTPNEISNLHCRIADLERKLADLRQSANRYIKYIEGDLEIVNDSLNSLKAILND